MAKGAEVGEAASHHPGGKPHITSERHDILYSKARYVLHKRHIKRPWFNLNPFLERTDETVDLDNFIPEESRYIQRLESLVLCESYNSELPVDTRELALEKFFEYLNSEQWKDGCSIRVLEGQLLDQLLVSLYRLEREEIAIRHTTYAFGRNTRKITGCYKLADKESYGTREETLLIEFAYFGRMTKEQPNTNSQNPLEYLREGVAEYSDDDVSRTDSALPSLQEASSSSQVKRRSRASSIQVDQIRTYNLTDTNKTEIPKWGRRGSLMAKHVNAIGFLSALSPQNRRKSIAVTPSATPITSYRTFAGPPDKRRESVVCTPDDTRGRRRRSSVATTESRILTNRQRKSSMAQSSYPLECDDRTPSLPDVHCQAEEESSIETEDKAFYGHEFYLADAKKKSRSNEESTLTKLRRKKKDLQERRNIVREEQDRIANHPKKCNLPPLPPLDLAKIQENVMMHHTIKLPDKMPTFEEFVKLLKDDEYFDPRYQNKVRLKSKIIAQRYYIAKGMHRSSVMFHLEHIPNDVKYVGLTRRYMKQRASIINPIPEFNRDRRSSNGSKGSFLLPSLQESGRRTPRKPDGLSNVSLGSSQRFAEEVHGVTDSEPCKEHCLKSMVSPIKPRDEKVDRLRITATSQGRRSQTDVALSGQDVVLTTLTEENSVNNLNPSPSLRTGQASPMIPKMDYYDDEYESTDSDSEEDDLEFETPSLFDGTKVNVRYSVERLKRKRRLKRKKPAFLEILSKYYNMHAALKLFRKGSASREEKNARERAKRMGRLKKEVTKSKKKQAFVIGKPRKFSFNDVEQKEKLNLDTLSRGEFSKPDLTTFHEELRKAMDEFVIRREIVVSDKQTFHRSATSVTFTRKSCFQKKHVDV